MKDSALSIANYLIKLAHNEKDEIKPLRLMKLVYIVHGYVLAIYDRSAIDPRFDRVEAWKYGPVIPSVYHSFKSYGNSPITAETTVFTDDKNGIAHIDTPRLKDKEVIKVCKFVYRRYSKFSDWGLVEFLHKKASPWGVVYEEGKNNIIPDEYTKMYFDQLIKSILKAAENGE